MALELLKQPTDILRAMMDSRRGDGWPRGGGGSRSQPRMEYRDAYRGRERFSPAGSYEPSQTAKRMRHDGEDRQYGYDGGYGGPGRYVQSLPCPARKSKIPATENRAVYDVPIARWC